MYFWAPFENTDDPRSPSLVLLHERPTLLEQTNTALYLLLLEIHRSQSACSLCVDEQLWFVQLSLVSTFYFFKSKNSFLFQDIMWYLGLWCLAV